jgi:succinate-semialdehyde dehydrogenase/glutarate-semialdehyde dehydrogenase
MPNLSSINPLNGEVVGTVSATPPNRIPEMVARARKAQPDWRDLGTEGRAQLLGRAAGKFLTEAEPLARLITLEMGKPLGESTLEAKGLGGGLEGELREIVEALQPEVIEAGGLRSVLYRDPLGVCAAITPWNFPMAMPNWMVLPALAAGNTVVFKPSEETPLSGQAYADILSEHLPEGVLTVVHGADEVGKALVRSGVDLIAFTGSREVGKHILSASSGDLKRVILELGGKDPMIVLEDADLEEAARFAAWNSFRNAGQVCVSTERIFVHEGVADRFESLLVEEASKVVPGDGLREETSLGPMVNEGQRDHVLRQLAEAVQGGAKVLIGGDDHPDRFIVPTILTDVSRDMGIARDETFGPVVCMTRVASDEEAVELANETPFGLGAVVFGTNTENTTAVARRLTAGMVGINRACGGAPGTPWIGARESGFGFHKGRDGHRQFTQTRVVSAAADF